MSTYAIGDVQGCYTALQRLLDHLEFDATVDHLWFTGDLVNRGLHSLEVLRLLKSLGSRQKTVLGNHDLHLLACAYQQHSGWKEDTFNDILEAPDCDELINWLRQQPLFHYDATLHYGLVHAGLAPDWDIPKALALSQEVEAVLKSADPGPFLAAMYGDQPDAWHDNLEGFDRLHTITNYFTRVRFCYPDGRLELSDKGPANAPHKGLVPWFKLPQRLSAEHNIAFGHWAALGGITHTAHTFSLDTGCVWGFKLTAMRLEDGKRFNVGCESDDRPS